MTKRCFKCGDEKPLDEFYAHPHMLDGHLNACKPCLRAYAKQRRIETDAPRQLDTHRYRNDPARRAHLHRQAKKWRVKNPEKYLAHQAVFMAIKRGKLKRQPCEVCGSTKVHAHHEDYAKRFEVRWLCPLHHAREHHNS